MYGALLALATLVPDAGSFEFEVKGNKDAIVWHGNTKLEAGKVYRLGKNVTLTVEWFNGTFTQYDDVELPIRVGQHLSITLNVPRPVYWVQGLTVPRMVF